MNTPDFDDALEIEYAEHTARQESKRRRLLALFVVLFLATCYTSYMFIRYLRQPEPLPDMLPVALARSISYAPTFKYAITGIDKPVGVAYSPTNQRIYVTEGSGERLIKAFDLNGNLAATFSAPGTTKANRKPIYAAVDGTGRLFVSEHYNNVINIFDGDGNYLDSIIDRDQTLSKYIAEFLGAVPPEGTLYFYNNSDKRVYFQLPRQEIQSILGPPQNEWAPVGLRFDVSGNLLVTNFVGGKHSVLIYSAAALSEPWSVFNPAVQEFGVQGSGAGELSYPNSVVADREGFFYVSDGNNGRISVWSADFDYRMFFGYGSSESSLNLPRGMWLDSKERLHVADAVGHFIRVYDVSGPTPTFLYNFGGFGSGDGFFNHPTDIVIDSTGRLFLTDRENNRIQVWTY
jgi:tripartite motif-containing protein 71